MVGIVSRLKDTASDLRQGKEDFLFSETSIPFPRLDQLYLKWKPSVLSQRNAEIEGKNGPQSTAKCKNGYSHTKVKVKVLPITGHEGPEVE